MSKAIRYLFILILLSIVTPIFANESHALWNSIRDAGQAYENGKHDSAFAMIRRLLPVASAQGDHFAVATLHHLRGTCLFAQGKAAAARTELAECVKVGEANGFLNRAVKTHNSFMFETMLSSYARLAIDSKDLGKTAESLHYAKNGLQWVEKCQDVSLRLQTLGCFVEVLADNKDYALIRQPLQQGVKDAENTHQSDYARLYNTYLKEVETALQPTKKDTANETVSLASLTPTNNQQSPALSQNDSAKSDQKKTAYIKYVKVRNERIFIIAGILAVILIVSVAYILYQRRRRRKDVLQAEQEKTESYVEGQENERSRLAKELHDGVSNQLLAIQMKLNEDGLTPQTMQLLIESREQVRRVSHQLIPPEFEHTNLKEAIANYAAELDSQKCEVTFTSTPQDADWSVIPKTKALEIYRITQEAVSNALKHSGATAIAIGLHLNDDNTLNVIISDNGPQHIEEKKGANGIGKRTITERTAALEGKIEFYRHPFGNAVKLTVKLNNV